MYWDWAKTVKPDVQEEKLNCQRSRGSFLKNTPERNLETKAVGLDQWERLQGKWKQMWWGRGSWERWEGRLARASYKGHLYPMVIRSSLGDYCYYH